MFADEDFPGTQREEIIKSRESNLQEPENFPKYQQKGTRPLESDDVKEDIDVVPNLRYNPGSLKPKKEKKEKREQEPGFVDPDSIRAAIEGNIDKGHMFAPSRFEESRKKDKQKEKAAGAGAENSGKVIKK